MSTKSRVKLNKELRDRIKMFFFTQVAAAKEMGLDYGMLKASLSQNRYNRSELLVLARRLNLPENFELLERQYDFEYRESTRVLDESAAGIVSAFELLKRQVNRLRSSFQGLDHDVRRLYQLMGEGDLLLLVLANEPPIEWDEQGLWEDIAKAIQRGASICYIFPSDRQLDILIEMGAIDSKRAFGKCLAAFRRRIEHKLSHLGYPEHPVWIVGVEHDSGAFFAPRHKFSLYRHIDANSGTIHDLALSAYPLSISESQLGLANRRAFPLDTMFADCLRRFCSHLVETAIFPEEDQFDGHPVTLGNDTDQQVNEKVLHRVLELLMGRLP